MRLITLRQATLGMWLTTLAACGADPPLPIDNSLSPLRERMRVRIHDRPAEVETFDLNQDGLEDVIIGGDSISILIADGSGGWERPTIEPYNPMEQAIDFDVGDVNGDGHLDIVVAEHNADEPQFLLWLGTHDGAFRFSRPFVVDAEPHLHTIALIDFNQDGHLDVVTDSWPENQLVLIKGKGDGTFEVPGVQVPVPPAPMQNLAIADFDGDGLHDVVTPAHDRQAVTLMLGDREKGLRPAPGSPFDSFGGFSTVAAVDINRDGNQDALAVHRSDSSTQYKVDGLSVLLGDGKGGLKHAPGSPFTELPERSNSLTVGDWNGDGWLDVAVLGEVQHQIGLYLGSAQGLQAGGTFRVEGRTRGLGSIDLGQEGRHTLLVTDFASGELVLLEFQQPSPAERSGN